MFEVRNAYVQTGCNFGDIQLHATEGNKKRKNVTVGNSPICGLYICKWCSKLLFPVGSHYLCYLNSLSEDSLDILSMKMLFSPTCMLHTVYPLQQL